MAPGLFKLVDFELIQNHEPPQNGFSSPKIF